MRVTSEALDQAVDESLWWILLRFQLPNHIKTIRVLEYPRDVLSAKRRVQEIPTHGSWVENVFYPGHTLCEAHVVPWAHIRQLLELGYDLEPQVMRILGIEYNPWRS